MVLPPALYNAAGLATERVIVSGDFRQLPPILQTDEECLREELGHDVFALAGVQQDVDNKRQPRRTTMLEEQYRMSEPICQLISDPMYGGRLSTAAERNKTKSVGRDPFSGALTIVDTSTICPVANKDARGSWVNLMSALVVRNIIRHLADTRFATRADDAGVVVPYSGQRKLLERMLKDAGLTEVAAGTVHRYQGDEKRLIVLDFG